MTAGKTRTTTGDRSDSLHLWALQRGVGKGYV
jgi:hypothetical protein